tara:strand:+ start:939 stop:1259 length:321 start_codon:yes stop_codon:yes gene_type:complete
MQQPSESICLTKAFLDRWQTIVETVDITNIPVEYIDHLVVHTKEQEIVVSVIELLEQGIPPEDLEIALEDKMEEIENEIESVDYILNMMKISTDIQSTTDETLKNL